MTNRRRLSAFGVLGGIVVLLVATAAPAGAEVIVGNCTGSATFSNGAVVTESTPLSETVTVPNKDIVQYSGNTHLTPPDQEEGFGGYVAVRLPVGGSWIVADWPVPSDAKTKEVDDSGSYAYEVPGYVPQGTGGLEVTAYHSQRGQVCQVAVSMALSGSPGPAAIVATIGVAAFGAGVIGAGFSKGSKSP